MGLFAKKNSENLGTESARCGRCAEILPDDTLTYCPSCGVPFSRVPPTTTYHRLDERRRPLTELVREFGRHGLLTLVLATAVMLTYFLASNVSREMQLAHIRVTRPVVFHSYFVDAFPRVSKATLRQSIAIAVQSFDDHFGIALKEIEIREDSLPTFVAQDFRGPWQPDEITGDSPMLLKNWENRIYPRLFIEWRRDPYAPLHVVITNIPIFAESRDSSLLELRHLAGSGLISGLGHPGLVVATTYRMLAAAADFEQNGAGIRSPADQARFLGEYVLAHELGHGLLALSDTVVESQAKPALRAPASVSTGDHSQCLMHTDEGGGYAAWRELRKRELGTRSRCQAYEPTLAGFAARERALKLGQAGAQAQARRLLLDAEKFARPTSQDWLLSLWREERAVLSPPFAWDRLFQKE